MRVAVLDDEPAQLQHAVHALEQHCFIGVERVECVEFASGEALRRALRQETFDLLVLDWNVPDLDGSQLLFWLRHHRKLDVPVLMVSSRTAERDVANALGMGADDYVVKPMRAIEFAARARRLLTRRHGDGSGLEERFGNWVFDMQTQEVVVPSGNSSPSMRVSMSDREFRLALTLFRNAGRAVSRSHLLETTGHPSEIITTRLLDNHIYRLRNKLALSQDKGVLLQTVYGQGYRLQLLSNESEPHDT
jgi:DNA-binding response OmpR family regulator